MWETTWGIRLGLEGLIIRWTHFLKSNVFLPQKQSGSPCKVVVGQGERSGFQNGSGGGGKMTLFIWIARSLSETQLQEEEAGIDPVGKGWLGIRLCMNSRGQQVVVGPPRTTTIRFISNSVSSFWREFQLFSWFYFTMEGQWGNRKELQVKSTSNE